MNKPMYNNIGVAAIGIQFVLQYTNSMSLAKSLLIMPFLVHKELLNYLSNGNPKFPKYTRSIRLRRVA